MKQEIKTDCAPKAIGPYSQALKAGDMVLVSGQLGVDPATGDFSSENTADQARQSLENLKAILAETGYTMDRVIKTTVFLTDMKDFSAVNEVYARYFTAPYPARSCVQVSALPKGGKVEIEAMAL